MPRQHNFGVDDRADSRAVDGRHAGAHHRSTGGSDERTNSGARNRRPAGFVCEPVVLMTNLTSCGTDDHAARRADDQPDCRADHSADSETAEYRSNCGTSAGQIGASMAAQSSTTVLARPSACCPHDPAGPGAGRPRKSPSWRPSNWPPSRPPTLSRSRRPQDVASTSSTDQKRPRHDASGGAHNRSGCRIDDSPDSERFGDGAEGIALGSQQLQAITTGRQALTTAQISAGERRRGGAQDLDKWPP